VLAHVRVEQVGIDLVLPLRAAVLRPGLPVDTARYEQDLLPTTVHLAALSDATTEATTEATTAVIGCATWSPEPYQGRPGWRLRGMATADTVRGQGVGALLLEAGLELGRASGAEVAWCNARTSALGFYRRHGFTAVGEEFDVEYAGPHYRMWRPLP
jgi:predicted GNAT family N-acyltransferase